MPLVDENHQEWVFTLYDFDNSGRVTKEVMAILLTLKNSINIEKNKNKQTAGCLKLSVCMCVCGFMLQDMSSLMHTICEVVEASVKQSALCNSKTLRIKLTVTPLTSSNNRRGESFLLYIEKRFFIFIVQSIDQVEL